MTPPWAQPPKPLALDQIAVSDSPYRLCREETDVTSLVKSLQTFGLLNPLWVLENPSGYTLVHGFRRYQAARALGWNNIPALTAPATESPVTLLRRAITDNMNGRGLSLWEKARATQQLNQWNVPLEESVQNDLPLLGYSPVEKIYRALRSLSELDETLLTFLSDRDCPLKRVNSFTALDPAAQTFLAQVVQNLKPTLNQLESIARLIKESAKKSGGSANNFIEKENLARWSHPPQNQTTAALQQLSDHLNRLRFPEYTRQKDTMNVLLKKLRLPPGLKIQWDDTFENTGLRFTADLVTEKDLRQLGDFLSHGENRKILEDLRKETEC